MKTLLQDIRFGARQLFKMPGFSLTAIVSLALGIGATTAVFSVASFWKNTSSDALEITLSMSFQAAW